MQSRTRAHARIIRVAVAAPRGFTLVEVLLAVILISVGLLALVAGSAMLLRQANDLRIRRAALQAGADRVQLLGAGSCAGASGDASGPFGIHEHWSAELVGNGIREVCDSVTFSVRGEARTFVLRTRLPC
jgi:prepilin-type N-terminal cleavage/methylation domain-containing protein